MKKRSVSKRVLMLLENNPYRKDVRVSNEARTLLAAGYQVTVIAPKQRSDDPLRERAADGVLLYQFPEPADGLGFLSYVWEYGYATTVMFLLTCLVWVREGFDIIHAHNPPDMLFLIAAFFKPFGKKFVFDHHDLSPEVYAIRYEGGGSRRVHAALLFLEKWSLKLADQVICTNASYKRIATQRAGIDPNKITIVRNGPDIDGDLYAVSPHPDVRQRADVILGYVGMMGPQDGLDYLLRAVHHLVYSLERRHFSCVLMGTGAVIAQLKALAKELEIEPYVWFAGWISAGDGTLNRYLAAIDIGLVPDPSNTYNDHCTMIKVMEYMALGKPIVAFDLPEHRVSAGEAAVYATGNDELEFAQHIATLMDDPQRRQRMGAIGQERIHSTFAWRFQKEHLLSAYGRLTVPRPATPSVSKERPQT